jgi:hypothetical protein
MANVFDIFISTWNFNVSQGSWWADGTDFLNACNMKFHPKFFSEVVCHK